MAEKLRASLVASCLASLVFLFAAGSAGAWEWAYGPPMTLEQANRRVMPVVNCPGIFGGPGFIAVGTWAQGTANSEVYVVRTNLGGGPVFQVTFDVQGLGLVDEGIALAQLPNNNGYMILSNTMLGGVWAPALTRIDCLGNVVAGWSQLYPDAGGLTLRGHDLIRAQTGNPAAGTAPGDFVIAGLSFNGADNDAFLMRTTNAGVLIWNASYDNNGNPEQFNALVEALPGPGQITGDVVAVGREQVGMFINTQGLAARVNGDTGAIGAAPQCMAHHGAAIAAETYYSVIRLATPPNVGLFAMVGVNNSMLWLDDVWVTIGNPCNVGPQGRIGNGGDNPTAEGGYDIREVLGAAVGIDQQIAPVGSLAITGYQGAAMGGPYDAPLLFVNVATLAPLFANVFGDHAGQNEIGFSLAQNLAGGAAGFIIGGLTQTDWQGVGDPRDLYLVDTLARGGIGTNCDAPWVPVGVATGWVPNFQVPNLQAPAMNVPSPSVSFGQNDPFQVCF